MSVNGYLGLDVGGTGAKAGVFDASGKMLGFGHRTYSLSSSIPGQAEIDIEELYQAAREAAVEAIKASGAKIRGFAIASQGQTFVTLDKADRPLHKAIIWYDSRASEQADRMLAQVTSTQTDYACHSERSEESAQCFGISNPETSIPWIEAIATAPKIMWLRENMPQVMSHAGCYLLLPDYFAYRLTGEAVTDPSTASSTGLYAEDAPGYCANALEAAGIEESEIAVIKPSGTPIAKLRPDVARQWNLDSDVLLVTGTNDQYAGALGAGNCRPSIVTETSGTCLALITLTESLPNSLPTGLLPGRFPITQYQFVLAYAKTAGVLLDWYRKQFCPNLSFAELDARASASPIGSNGITVMPHFDGMVSPCINPSARGHICNLSLGHTNADIYRAVLESLAFCMRENLEAMRDAGLSFADVRSIGGGAKSDFWLQMKADVIGQPIERPAVAEAASLGAAALAAAGVGDFESISQAATAFYKPGTVFQPNSERVRMYQKPYESYLRLGKELCCAS